MSTTAGTFEQVARAMIEASAPLRRALGSTDAFRSFMLRLGWETTSVPPAYTQLGTAIAEAMQAVEALRDDPTESEILVLLGKAKASYLAINRIDQAPPDVDASAFLSQIGERLFEVLLTDYLAAHQPALFNWLSILNVIETESIPPTAHQRGHIRTHFHWHNIPKIIRDPLSLPHTVYGWGTQDLKFPLLLQHLSELCFAFGFPVFIGKAEESLANGYSDEDEELDEDSQWLKIPFYYITIADRELEAAISIVELKGKGSTLPGLAIQPHIPNEFPLTLRLASTIDLRVRAGTNAASQLGIVLRPGDASIKYPFQPGTTPPSAGIGIGFDFKPATPTLLLGSPKGTRLEFQGGSVDLGASSVDNDLDIQLAAQLKGLTLVLQPGEADSFLHNLLGDSERRITIPLGVEWSRRNGVHFAGSEAFETFLPANLSIGPVTVKGIALQLFAPTDHSADLTLAVGVQISGKLGPVSFAVEGMGFRLQTTFAQGNVGPFDLALGFKPPAGLGLAISAAGVTGGGFLGFDPQRAEYSGMLQLELAETIALKAIGLLTTRMPDGSKGYSLIVILTAEGFTPIPVGLGFTLTGIGGLVALHRTVRTEVLRDGLKTGTLNSILFPVDPLRNAPQIFSDLRRVFPPTAGRHVVGPMVQLRWGSPTLLTLDLALLVEFPAPIRVVVLGRLQVLLPNQTHPLIQIRMDALGVLDLSAETVALDATLYDSRILQFTLTGDMALRAGWGREPQFVLAIGGFHPRFAPPPGLPALKRLALQLADGDSLQLRCQAYLAVTSNTVQFGARVDLHAAGGGFSFDGLLGFDAIIQLAPLAFEVEVGAALALRYHGRLLMGITFQGRLAGPTPWQVEGKAKIKFLFFSVSVSFSRTFGSKTAPPLPAAVDVVDLIAAALADQRNWSGAVPRSSAPVVTLRETAPPTSGLRVHPWAELTLRERIAPLNRHITKLGTAPLVGGPTTVTVSVTDRAGASPWRTTPVHEPFARAQFEDLREDEQLAQPAFVPLQGGLTVAADDLAVDDEAGLAAPIAYETLVLDPTRPPERPKPGYVLSAAVLVRVAPFGAAGQAPARKRRRGNTVVTM
ncbi:MAG: hypothetical protein KA240_02540 [Nitrospira sp.]|nr:hypothetical protein [Nitrospira sp.]MBP6604534.1 hypothetical protein [Nitrospira sp.]HRA96305.1 hypothetical protein [Nitrospira sp.]